MDADARPEQTPSQTLGAKTAASTPLHPPGDDRTHAILATWLFCRLAPTRRRDVIKLAKALTRGGRRLP